MHISIGIFFLNWLALLSSVFGAPSLKTDDVGYTAQKQSDGPRLSPRVESTHIDLRRTMIRDFRRDILTLRARVPRMPPSCQTSILAELVVMVDKLAKATGEKVFMMKDNLAHVLLNYEKLLPLLERRAVKFWDLAWINNQRRQTFLVVNSKECKI
ncbi:hypothetical protein FRC03_004193 [Tulasnella sp. 419]|nr:hypothetical protein FRC02_011718 [Tulasnella sp. 418]KAG8962508.1 hypothetical protein FRC03_004193 [Tulasnella sp. 419]